jgi:hypothetical protein
VPSLNAPPPIGASPVSVREIGHQEGSAVFDGRQAIMGEGQPHAGRASLIIAIEDDAQSAVKVA